MARKKKKIEFVRVYFSEQCEEMNVYSNRVETDYGRFTYAKVLKMKFKDAQKIVGEEDCFDYGTFTEMRRIILATMRALRR